MGGARRPGSAGRLRCAAVAGVGGWVLLAGCSSDEVGRSDVEVAEARVSAAEEDLADAEAEFADASAAFCAASATYITALDRYGDLLTQTAPTVGDVEDAGTDLAQPKEEVGAEAEAATAAQRAVVGAEQELADAEAALAAAKSSGSPAPSAPAATVTPTPLAPEATVDRVQLAEAQLRTVQQGITDETPLSQASQQFNAAAVALQMSWLRLFSDAGCLTEERGGAGGGGGPELHHDAAAVVARRRLLRRRGGRGLRPDDGRRSPSAAEGQRPARHGHGRPGDRCCAAGRAGRQGRGRRRAGSDVHHRGAADAQARRVLGRPGRRAVDTRADRGAAGLPDRARRLRRPAPSTRPPSQPSRRPSPSRRRHRPHRRRAHLPPRELRPADPSTPTAAPSRWRRSAATESGPRSCPLPHEPRRGARPARTGWSAPARAVHRRHLRDGARTRRLARAAGPARARRPPAGAPRAAGRPHRGDVPRPDRLVGHGRPGLARHRRRDHRARARACRGGRAARHGHHGLHLVRAELPARGHRHPDRADRCAAPGHRAALRRPREPGHRHGDRGRAPARRDARARGDDLLRRRPPPRQPCGEGARRQLPRLRVAEPPAAGDCRRLDRLRLDPGPARRHRVRSGAAAASAMP